MFVASLLAYRWREKMQSGEASWGNHGCCIPQVNGRGSIQVVWTSAGHRLCGCADTINPKEHNVSWVNECFPGRCFFQQQSVFSILAALPVLPPDPRCVRRLFTECAFWMDAGMSAAAAVRTDESRLKPPSHPSSRPCWVPSPSSPHTTSTPTACAGCRFTSRCTSAAPCRCRWAWASPPCPPSQPTTGSHPLVHPPHPLKCHLSSACPGGSPPTHWTRFGLSYSFAVSPSALPEMLLICLQSTIKVLKVLFIFTFIRKIIPWDLKSPPTDLESMLNLKVSL